MKNIFGGSVRFAVVGLSALALAACGVDQGAAVTQAEKPDTISGLSVNEPGEKQPPAGDGRLLRLFDEEKSLKADPECGEASEEFKPVILDVIDRFNQTAKENLKAVSITFIPAGHPDSPDGISVRVCSDSRIAAYAYSRTVAIHEGLLNVLKETADQTTLSTRKNFLFTSAVAFILYHELGHAHLDHVALRSLADEYDGLFDSLPELQADMFAAMAIRAAGYSMDGADIVFSVLEKINPSGSAVHPSSWERAEMVQRMDKRESRASQYLQ